MSSITIVKVPPGLAAPRINQAWVGITIPLPTPEELKANPPPHYGEGGKGHPQKLPGKELVVLRSRAVKALTEAGKKDAANHWNNLPVGTYLYFRMEDCKIVH